MNQRAGYGVKSNYKYVKHENNQFPILCDECMSDSEYMRFLKKPQGKECGICKRPFTVFSWKIESNKNKVKNTEVCSTCSKINNCCQSCVYDLKFNLPISIRNKFLGDKKIDMLISEGNREFFAHLAEENIDKLKLPYQESIQQKNDICSDFQNFKCKKGKNCDKKHTFINEEQKNELEENFQQIYKAYDSQNSKIILKYLQKQEVEVVEEKICELIDTKYSLEFKNSELLIDFQNKEDSIKFMKYYHDSMIINGKKIFLTWNDDQIIDINSNNNPPEPEDYVLSSNNSLIDKQSQNSNNNNQINVLFLNQYTLFKFPVFKSISYFSSYTIILLLLFQQLSIQISNPYDKSIKIKFSFFYSQLFSKFPSIQNPFLNVKNPFPYNLLFNISPSYFIKPIYALFPSKFPFQNQPSNKIFNFFNFNFPLP